MNEFRKIFRNSVALTISDLIERASKILLGFFMARIVYASGLGIYSAAMAYYGIIVLAGMMGATNYLVREIAKDPSKTSRYVTHFSVLGTVVSTLIITLFWLVLPYLGYSSELATSTYVIILAVIPGTLNITQRAVFIAHQRVEFITYTTLVSTVVNVCISLYLLMAGYGIVSLLIAFVIQQYLTMFCYFFLINRFIAVLHWKIELPFVLTLIREIKTFAALSILAGLFDRVEIIILSLVRDEAAVGFYTAGLKVVDLWHFLPQILMTNVFPVMARSHQSADRKSALIQDKSIKYLLIITLPLTVGIIAISEPLITLLYGPGFEPSVMAMQILAWSLPLNALLAVLWRVLAARNQQDLDLRARVITTLVRVGGGYFLISRWSALGAAISVPASLLLNTLLLVHYVSQDGTRLDLWRIGWRCSLAAAGMGVVTWTFSHQLQLWALVPLAAGIYVGLAILLRVFSPDDIALLRNLVRPAVAERG